MKRVIRNAGVIGAGVMGSTIAAHLANAGIEVLLLDIVPPPKPGDNAPRDKAWRDRLAQAGLDQAKKSKPASFYLPRLANRIAVGNLEDDLEKLSQIDWIIEVVVERLDIKQAVFEKIETVLTPGTIITSNTSGISVEQMCQGRSAAFCQHFAITHFFNPPRYMKLLEVVSGPDTRPEVLDLLVEVGQAVLGKGVVLCRDTPNFVANRIGLYSTFAILRAMESAAFSVEAVDALTGKVIGRAKSATCRTLDLVGLDTVVHVARNVHENALDDDQREQFVPPAVVQQMVDDGRLGQKAGQGFYKKARDADGRRQILSLDPQSLGYSPQEKVNLGSLNAARTAKGLSERIAALFYAKDEAGRFTFDHLSRTFVYAAQRLGEIADELTDIDNAMKWGFAWKLGPFEAWDAVGVRRSAEAMTAAGLQVPPWVQEMLDQGIESFYSTIDGVRQAYQPAGKNHQPIARQSQIILLAEKKAQTPLIAGNSGASLVDLGDGVVCLEFHTKMNAVGNDIIEMIAKATDIVSRDFSGLVIANHAENFSVGANLALLLFAAQEEEWDEIDWLVKRFQQTLLGLKYLDKPVVAAAAGMTLGGGCEVCLAADRVRYAAETYLGLVETAVGLIPGGGGTKELLVRCTENLFRVEKGGLQQTQIDLMPFVARAFEAIAMSKVSTSGPEAEKLGYLRRTDRMTISRDLLIHDAKQTVLALDLEGYRPPDPRTLVRVAGEPLQATIKAGLWGLMDAGYVSEHDVTVSTELARVLCGGNVQRDTMVSETYLLDLEREAFLRLCGMPLSQARMGHMLKTGKPLRN